MGRQVFHLVDKRFSKAPQAEYRLAVLILVAGTFPVWLTGLFLCLRDFSNVNRRLNRVCVSL